MRRIALVLLLGLLGLEMTGCAVIYTARYQKGNKQVKEIGLLNCPATHMGIPLYRDIEQVDEDGMPVIPE